MHRTVAVPVIAAVVAAGAAAAVIVAVSGPAGRPGRPRPASYYLSLGDSLSQGVQPDRAGASVRTSQGYPDQLQAMLRPGRPGLRLVKLGCPGETTATMIHGGICGYRGGSQLAAAIRFLRAHRGRVALITIDIGANDPNACILHPSLGTAARCVGSTIPGAASNLARILRELRAASGGHAQLAAGYNLLLARTYAAAGVRVADVASAFRTGDFGSQVSRPALGTAPRNVALICSWTWACAPPPRGPNQHANAAGYRVIAEAFRCADRG